MPHRTLQFSQVLVGVALLLVLAVVGNLAASRLHSQPREPMWSVPGGDPIQGRALVVQYGCGACHVVPGIRSATGRVGPRLEGIREQVYLGGVLPNGPDNLAAWIERPRDFSPQTAMPNLGITPEEARHIAAYLYSMR